MTALHERATGRIIDVRPNAADAIEDNPKMATEPHWIWGLTRLAMGWVFLWPFLDKTFGLGFATEAGEGWIDGGSPTFGFLTFGTSGPFAEFFQTFAGATWANWLFMIGLFGVGAALLAGTGVRIAAAAGSALLILMWLAALPPTNNPFLDDHLVYALVLAGLAAVNAGDIFGLGRRWSRLELVKRFPILR